MRPWTSGGRGEGARGRRFRSPFPRSGREGRSVRRRSCRCACRGACAQQDTGRCTRGRRRFREVRARSAPGSSACDGQSTRGRSVFVRRGRLRASYADRRRAASAFRDVVRTDADDGRREGRRRMRRARHAGAAERPPRVPGRRKPLVRSAQRPGHTLVVLCSPDTADAMVSAVLRETSTFGVRRADMSRYELDRTIEAGPDGVRVKKGTGFGVEKSKREFDDEVSVQRKEQVK